MSEAKLCVLDASAVLASLLEEPGCERLNDLVLENAVASTVNLAEVQAKLVQRGYDPDEAWEDTLDQVAAAEPFTAEHAKIAGTLVNKTRSLGLSLADRSCLALAISLKAPVYTTDRAWKGLRIGVPIHVIR